MYKEDRHFKLKDNLALTRRWMGSFFLNLFIFIEDENEKKIKNVGVRRCAVL